MNEYRWNNFHEYFPGGDYRVSPFLNQRQQQLVSDLDRVFAEQKFDLPRFQELHRKGLDVFEEYREITIRVYRDEKREFTPDEEQKTSELERLQKENARQLDVLVEPVIRRMMELGYSEFELIR